MADLPEEINGVKRLEVNGQPGIQPGDWDTGMSKFTDGAFTNRADEGNLGLGSVPYFQGSEFKEVGGTFLSPNRIIASAGWFGSLPSGLQRRRPYETLLFRTDYTSHPGKASPPDHLLLDLFNMPVVEPYPISEPFSTAGKVNMNYQLIPFGGYLKRDTAMRAVLRSEKMLCIPVTATAAGHSEDFNNDSTDYRHQIDEDTTLAFLERHWKDTANPENQVFRSASQVCELDLYPKKNNSSDAGIPVATSGDGQGTTSVDARWTTFWGTTYALTGDNARERPYARLYPRLTTKSNTFTVHLRVQSLGKPANATNQNQWDESRDHIYGEYRGSAIIERYLDPADRRFDPTDGTVAAADKFNPDVDSLENAYRFRVLSTKQFAP